ncbi:hypothetical protein [Piscinibacter terrae]|nr:hypothetical protein [Albitalea terrae]
MSAQVASAIQPVDLRIGIKQSEVYAAFEPSMGGASAAAACGAVPGLGILLAAACGGALGAVDATVNASRAKTADEIVRPLKDETVDAKFDQLLTDAIGKSLQGIPKFQVSGTTLTKTVDPKAYEETFRASTASAVMFVNVDYHVSPDFSTLQVTARGLVYPRSSAARTAAGLAAELPAPGKDPVLAPNTAAYHVDVAYHAKLPVQATAPADYVAAWKADNARLLRAGMNDGAAQVGRLLAEDLQRAPDSQRTVIRKAEPAKGLPGDLLAESNGGQLMLMPGGMLVFKTTLSKDAGTASAAVPTATSAAGTVAAQ